MTVDLNYRSEHLSLELVEAKDLRVDRFYHPCSLDDGSQFSNSFWGYILL